MNSLTLSIQQLNEMQITNQEREALLRKQRALQLKNSGITALFVSGTFQSSPYFCVSFQDINILRYWFQTRYHINVYDFKVKSQLLLLDKSNVRIHHNCILLPDMAMSSLENGCYYILAKNNATIQLLRKALIGTSMHPQIQKFINFSDITQVSENKLFELEEWAYYGLNDGQKKAIEIVSKQRLTFIKGPPGCGKTKTIARLVTIFTYNKYKMLIGSVTNRSNMNILQAILRQSQQMNYLPNIVLYISKESYQDNISHPPYIRSLTFRFKLVESFMMVNDQYNMPRQQIERLLDIFWGGGVTSKTFISMYYQAVALVHQMAQVMIVTTTSASKINRKLTEQQIFQANIGILDQASQASWADSLCFLNNQIMKMVFIGDEKQLTPTVISQNQILKQTMFSKLYKKNTKYYVLLDVQYRMHPSIAEFPNFYFYQNELKNGVNQKQRSSQIPFFNSYPLSFIDCQCLQSSEVQPKSGKKNYWNRGQAQIIGSIISLFPPQHLDKVGIISPYDLQIKVLANYLSMFPQLTIKTCDGYQGSEKQYIIISCVRSNKQGKVGFFSQQNRLNVTLTRAKRGIILIGNKQTFENSSQQSNVWKQYMKYLSHKNLILSEKNFRQYVENIKNPKKQDIIQLKLKEVTGQDSDEELNKHFKDLKKSVKAILNQIKNNNLRQPDQKSQHFKNRLMILLKQNTCKYKETEMVVTSEVLQAYKSLKLNSCGVNMEKLLQSQTSLLLECINKQSRQQFNHLRQKEIIKKAISLRVWWILYSYSYNF